MSQTPLDDLSALDAPDPQNIVASSTQQLVLKQFVDQEKLFWYQPDRLKLTKKQMDEDSLPPGWQGMMAVTTIMSGGFLWLFGKDMLRAGEWGLFLAPLSMALLFWGIICVPILRSHRQLLKKSQPNRSFHALSTHALYKVQSGKAKRYDLRYVYQPQAVLPKASKKDRVPDQLRFTYQTPSMTKSKAIIWQGVYQPALLLDAIEQQRVVLPNNG